MRQQALRAKWLAAAASLAMSFGLVGCGSGTSPIPPSKSSETAQKLSSKDQIKERVKMIAETGSGGSAVSGMKAGLIELKTTEAALATDLLKDVEKIERLQDPAQIKAIATKMLEKLNK